MFSWGSYLLQDSRSPMMAHISHFYDHAMMVVVMVVCLVSYVLWSMILQWKYDYSMTGSEGLEIIWTTIPAVMLISMAIPSLYSLYLLDEVGKAALTIKVIGHQWYWSYEYNDYEALEFDSYMIPIESLKESEFRLLSVDNNTVIPLGVETRVLVTSEDVIHSWTVPSMGVKIDAISGRLNQVNIVPIHVGESYGQCSEICGPLHSFMPICLEVVPINEFFKWSKSIN